MLMAELFKEAGVISELEAQRLAQEKTADENRARQAAEVARVRARQAEEQAKREMAKAAIPKIVKFAQAYINFRLANEQANDQVTSLCLAATLVDGPMTTSELKKSVDYYRECHTILASDMEYLRQVKSMQEPDSEAILKSLGA